MTDYFLSRLTTFGYGQTALFFLFLNLVILSGCVPVAGTGSSSSGAAGSGTTGPVPNGVYEDRVFTDQIQTVRLFQPDEQLYDAVIPITQNLPVFLTFDWLELGDEQEVYGELNARIIHCDADWQQSKLYSMDYLYDYNEFPITNEQLSFNTKVPFAHYRWALPKVKMPGNYAILVYEGNDENNPLFIKRFMVYNPLLSIRAGVQRSSGVKERDTHHQLEFVIDYQNLDIPNPYNDVYILIRQNQQWFNAISGLKPTFVREDVKELEYRQFDLKNNFWAASEFRYFDLRTVSALGQNVAEIRQEAFPVEAFLLPDRSRAGEAYSQFNDLNGGFIIENLEIRGGELNSDYLLTHFFLDAAEKVEGDVYVIGAFNNRTLTEEVRMTYDPLLEGYQADILLKQGFYNYLYYVDNGLGKNPYQFDGSHFETENLYEIFVYTRPPGARADMLVGYTALSSSAFR
jgi:hypothetical protein